MTKLARTSLIALALAGAPLAAQTAPGSFRLPTPTPTATDIQGPVDPDAPILTRPRDTSPTPTPTPRPTPVPTTAPPPRAIVLPTPQPAASSTNGPAPARSVPTVTATGRAGTPADAASVSPDAAAPSLAPSNSATYLPAPLPTASTTTSIAPPAQNEGIPGWLYALGGLLVGAGAVAALMWRRRQSEYVEPGAIERPRVAPAASAPPAAGEPAASGIGPQLTIEARALRMSRSMVYATLSYEVLVTNRGGQPLTDVRLGADLVTAHARIPTDQQLADPLVPLTPVKTFEQLDPGQSVTVSGELRLPVAEIRPIPHGKAVVYVPLLRVRAEAQDLIPVARTFVVGLPGGMNQRLQPFRLDEMPQTYRGLSQHALD